MIVNRESAPPSFADADLAYDAWVYGDPSGEPRRSHSAPSLDAETCLARMRRMLALANACADPQCAQMYVNAAVSALASAVGPMNVLQRMREAA